MAVTWIVVADRSRGKILQLFGTKEPIFLKGIDNPEGRLQLHEFAKRIADELEHARDQQAFTHLALICAPNFLGALRDQLSKECQRALVTEIAKDIVEMDEKLMLSRAKKDVAEALRSLSL